MMGTTLREKIARLDPDHRAERPAHFGRPRLLPPSLRGAKRRGNPEKRDRSVLKSAANGPERSNFDCAISET
jgi:hypothetical protein